MPISTDVAGKPSVNNTRLWLSMANRCLCRCPNLTTLHERNGLSAVGTSPFSLSSSSTFVKPLELKQRHFTGPAASSRFWANRAATTVFTSTVRAAERRCFWQGLLHRNIPPSIHLSAGPSTLPFSNSCPLAATNFPKYQLSRPLARLSSTSSTTSHLHCTGTILKRRRHLHVLVEIPEDNNDSFAKAEPRVTSYFINAGYDLVRLRCSLQSTGAHVIYRENFLIAEGSHFFNQQGCSAIVFKNGCAVLWNMSRANENKFLDHAKDSEKPCPGSSTDIMFVGESEELDVFDSPSASNVTERGIELTTSRLRLTDKVAASFALMTAVRLNVIEKKIERQLQVERQNIDNWKVHMCYGNLRSLAELLFKSMTNLHQLRYELNIEHALQDVPDILWEFDSQSRFFLKLQKSFDVQQRIDLLNARVSLTFDYLNTFADYVDKRHSSRLEKIIIILIFLELVLGVIQFFKRQHDESGPLKTQWTAPEEA